MILDMQSIISPRARRQAGGLFIPHISGETDFARERDSKGGIVNFTKTSFTEVC